MRILLKKYQILERIIKELKLEVLTYDKWGPLREMIRDVGEIEYKKNQDMNINERFRSSLKSNIVFVDS